MKACILTAPNQFCFQEVPKPVPQAGEVLLKVKLLGVCGTDVSVYRGNFAAKQDVILGHEFCAEVEQVGTGVWTCKPGDFVASAASYGCGKCYYCSRGLPSYCDSPRSLGRIVDGALAEYIVVNQDMVYQLTPDITLEEGQAVVGIATALRAVQRSGMQMGMDVLIMGAGYVGLQMLQFSKLMGTHVTIVDIENKRLELARELGADVVVNAKESPQWEAEQPPADLCIEAAGSIFSLRSCINLCRRGGTVLEYGTSADEITGIAQKDFYYKEISLVGTKGGYGYYEKAVKLLQTHKIQINPLLTHIIPFAEAPKAFDIMDRKLDNVIRSAIIFD